MSGDTASDRNGEGRAIALWTAVAVLLFGTLSVPYWTSVLDQTPAEWLATAVFGVVLAILSAIDVKP